MIPKQQVWFQVFCSVLTGLTSNPNRGTNKDVVEIARQVANQALPIATEELDKLAKD